MILAHLDLDAFFAAVEELENPELRSRPLVVGGDPHGRGVVATANYEARKYGIHSAMSSAEALRRCPHALFLRPRHTVYREYSRAVWDCVRGIVPTVERTGLDEGYLDLGDVVAGGALATSGGSAWRSGMSGGSGKARPSSYSASASDAEDFLKARAVAEAVRTAVRAATSLTCSLGVAASKVVAKIASDHRKPGGLTVVVPGTEAEFLAPFDVRKLPGIGPKAEERLRGAGVATIGALARLGDDELRRLLPGSVGRMLRDRARGIDGRGLELEWEPVSVSTEETFERDVDDRERLHDELGRMAEHVAQRLRSSGRTARTVTTKLRYANFSIRSRSTTLRVGTDDGALIAELACANLDRALRDRPGALRLVGVGVSGLAEFRQLALV